MAMILEASGAVVTANDMIETAYRHLGDIGTGEAMTAYQAKDGLKALNGMLDLFSIERLMIYVIKQEQLTWTANTASMTIGVGADLDTRRPDRIENGTYFMDANSIAYPAYPVTVTRNREVYDKIEDKTTTTSYPELLYYEPTVTWGTLYLYPVPDQSLTMYLNSWQALQYFDTLTEAISLPPGYRTMIEYNLAMFLEAETGLVLPEPARMLAYSTRKVVKRHNNLPIFAQTEVNAVLNGRGRSDIEAGR